MVDQRCALTFRPQDWFRERRSLISGLTPNTFTRGGGKEIVTNERQMAERVSSSASTKREPRRSPFGGKRKSSNDLKFAIECTLRSMNESSLAAMPTKSAAATPSESGFNISLRVPTVCDLDAGEFQVNGSQSEFTGHVFEYCNSSRGFQVIASHRPLQHSEIVEIDYGEQNSLLGEGGLSMIGSTTSGQIGLRPLGG